MKREKKLFFDLGFTVEEILYGMETKDDPFWDYRTITGDIIEDEYDIETELAMIGRFKIHTLWMAGLFKDEQKSDVRRIDNELTQNSWKYIRGVKGMSSSRVEEFIGWLMEAVNKEDRADRKMQSV
jgi:hypothetical protein